MSETAAVARALFDAYETSDRSVAEALIASDFRFTSPLDNGINRERYFEICWPANERIDAFDIDELVVDNGRAFVTYEVRWTDGTGSRNTEVLTVRDGQITTVEVYFGWTTPHDVPAGEHRDAGNEVMKSSEHRDRGDTIGATNPRRSKA